jgi:hypothetical protein
MEETTEIPYICSECKAEGVRLWREYQTFLNNITLKCRACSEVEQKPALERRKGSVTEHIQTDTIGWRVPAVPDDTGTFWGYTSVPQDRVDWWKALPEALP